MQFIKCIIDYHISFIWGVHRENIPYEKHTRSLYVINSMLIAVDKENSGTEDTKINKLFDAVEKGDNQAVERLVSRNPNLVGS